MSRTEDTPVPQRRRGAALETALLDAAWSELTERGYERFTIESVAERARTSRAVVYRRWPTRGDLVHAALLHEGARRQRQPVPDTGSLRGDVIELLQRANATRVGLGILMLLQLGGYYEETGTNLRDLRRDFTADREDVVARLVERGRERGEVRADPIPPRVLALPFDLFRHELTMTMAAVPEEVVESIVDDVFLPLVAP